ncbi:MAG: hypothetical protein HFJ38_06150 [Bacilli bacterium]|nr:hypothetical protein [Bacilli bacterium]
MCFYGDDCYLVNKTFTWPVYGATWYYGTIAGIFCLRTSIGEKNRDDGSRFNTYSL